jgi:hypothetical protein
LRTSWVPGLGIDVLCTNAILSLMNSIAAVRWKSIFLVVIGLLSILLAACPLHSYTGWSWMGFNYCEDVFEYAIQIPWLIIVTVNGGL